MKLLGPWPILQLVFGVAVLGFGVYMIVQGSRKKDDPQSARQLEDRKNEWRAYEQLENIEQNSFEQLKLLARIVDKMEHSNDAMRGLAAAIWNRKENL